VSRRSVCNFRANSFIQRRTCEANNSEVMWLCECLYCWELTEYNVLYLQK
jgi:hypothetical protein